MTGFIKINGVAVVAPFHEGIGNEQFRHNIVGAAGVTAKSFGIRQRGKIDPIFVADIQDLSKIIADIAGDDDVLLLQGAGSIGTVPNVLLANFPHDNASF